MVIALSFAAFSFAGIGLPNFWAFPHDPCNKRDARIVVVLWRHSDLTREDSGPHSQPVHTRHKIEDDKKEQHGYALVATGPSLLHG